jgi:hypothetical protein
MLRRLDPASFWRVVAEQLVVRLLEDRGFNTADEYLEEVLGMLQNDQNIEDPDTPSVAGAMAMVSEFEQLALSSRVLHPIDRYELQCFANRVDGWKYNPSSRWQEDCFCCDEKIDLIIVESGSVVAQHAEPVCMGYAYATEALGISVATSPNPEHAN